VSHAAFNKLVSSPLPQLRNKHAGGAIVGVVVALRSFNLHSRSVSLVLNVILFFIKYPTPGKVKTRIATTVGAARAAEIYRRLAERVCSCLPRDAEIIAVFDPPTKRAEIEEWLTPLSPFLKFIPQHSGDLGTRLSAAFAAAFNPPTVQKKVAAIGSDCVDLDTAIFAETWRALDQDDCVIGPAGDGGYYLLALRKPAPTLFSKINWSTERVLNQTLTRAAAAQLSVHLLPKLTDIDTEEEWRRLEQRLPI
jgi:rSAM/selenodomain-associated transferase 1